MSETSGSALTELANRAVQLADKGEASSIALFDDLIRRIRNLPDSAQTSLVLAQALFYRGRTYCSVTSIRDLEQAATDLRRARRLFALFSDTRHEAECLGQLGVVEAQRYEHEVNAGAPRGSDSEAYREAERLWKASLGLAKDPAALNTNLANLAKLYVAGTEWSLARDAYSALLSHSESREDAKGAAQASFGLALSLAGLGQRRQARRVARETVRRSAAIGPDADHVGQAAARLAEQLS